MGSVINLHEKVLKVCNLVKTYQPSFMTRFLRSAKSFTAVKSISFDVSKGEILGFLGPNGAGKTTTVHMLLDSLKPTSGDIFYFNEKLTCKNRAKLMQSVGFMSTYIGLPKRLTVTEVLMLYGGLYGIPHTKLKNIVYERMRQFSLFDLKHRETGMLSAGQTSRVMLAKAYLAQPKIVLLDEPTAALDPDVAAEIRHFIWEHTKQYGTSVLFASHNMYEVAEMCDRVIVLQNGIIIESDSPDNLVGRIKTAYVSLLIGPQMDSIVRYCQSNTLKYTIEGHYIQIQVEEEAVANLLIGISQEGIMYTNISIKKPNLEDYFIQLSRASVNGGDL